MCDLEATVRLHIKLCGSIHLVSSAWAKTCFSERRNKCSADKSSSAYGIGQENVQHVQQMQETGKEGYSPNVMCVDAGIFRNPQGKILSCRRSLLESTLRNMCNNISKADGHMMHSLKRQRIRNVSLELVDCAYMLAFNSCTATGQST